MTLTMKKCLILRWNYRIRARLRLNEPKRRDTYLDPWYPEDATVEVWRQEGDDLLLGIQRSLDANRIHCRCDSDARGGKKIFVRPERRILCTRDRPGNRRRHAAEVG